MSINKEDRRQIFQGVMDGKFQASTHGWIKYQLQRYMDTFDFGFDYWTQMTKVIDLGAPLYGDPFIVSLREAFPHLQIENYAQDLRQPFTLPSDAYDAVFSMEVIEHIKDIESPYDGTFENYYYKGMESSLRETYRILKPGGIMVLTTPNAGSIGSICNAIAGRSPFVYAFHVREFTLPEMTDRIHKYGFHIDKLATYDSFNYEVTAELKERVKQFLLHLDGNGDLRGNEMMFVARK